MKITVVKTGAHTAYLASEFGTGVLVLPSPDASEVVWVEAEGAIGGADATLYDIACLARPEGR